jgi:hypothetical protein
VAQQHLVGQHLLIIEASQSHSATPHSVGLLWTSDRPDARDLYLVTHNTHKRQKIQKHSKRAAADPRLSAATGIGVVNRSRTKCRMNCEYNSNKFNCKWRKVNKTKRLQDRVICIFKLSLRFRQNIFLLSEKLIFCQKNFVP